MKANTSIMALMVALGVAAVAVPTVTLAQSATDDTTTTTETTVDPMAGGPETMMHARMGEGPMGGRFDFDAIDADKDGKVTQEELTAYRAAQVAGLDADKDGKITEAELTTFITAKMTERAAEMAKARIAAQDADGDGVLSAEELAAPPAPANLFARLDTDGDGAVSKAEADAAQERMADRMGGRGERGERGHGGGFGGWFGRHHGMSDN